MNEPFQSGLPGRPPEGPLTIIPGGTGTPIPEAPDTLDSPTTWVRLWTVGRAWLSNEAHYDLMRILCEAIEDRDRLRSSMRRKARITKGSVGQERVHPALKELDAMESKIARLLELAQFTPPKQRQKVGNTGKSRLDQMRERRASGQDGTR